MNEKTKKNPTRKERLAMIENNVKHIKKRVDELNRRSIAMIKKFNSDRLE